MKKLVLPWIAWSIIIYTIRGVLNPIPEFSAMDFLGRFLSNGVEGIYWFFPAIISLTLAMPILSMLSNHKRLLWYITGISFMLFGIVQPIQKITGLSVTAGITFPVATYYVMYAILGYLLANTDISKGYRRAIYIGAILSLLFRLLFTYYWSTTTGVTDVRTWDYGSFVAVFPATAVFLIFKNHNWSNPFYQKHACTVAKISSCAYGIYLIHIILLTDVAIGIFGSSVVSVGEIPA